MGVGVDWTGPWAPDIQLFDDASFDVAFNAWVFQWVASAPSSSSGNIVVVPGR